MSSAPITLDNQRLKLTLHTKYGGTPGSLVHLPSQKEILTSVPAADENGWLMGGCPFLFPFAGRVYDSEQQQGFYNWGNSRYQQPIHGFASRLPWQLVAHDNNSARLELCSSPETLKTFPFPFKITNTFSLAKEIAHFDCTLINASKTADMPMTPGWHPFFNLNNSEAKLECGNSTLYQVDDRGLCGQASASKLNNLNLDRKSSISNIALNPDVGHHATMRIGPLNIKIDASPEFGVTVIWKPADANFICIEPWTRLPNAIASGQSNVIMLKPGQSWRGRYSISVEE